MLGFDFRISLLPRRVGLLIDLCVLYFAFESGCCCDVGGWANLDFELLRIVGIVLLFDYYLGG